MATLLLSLVGTALVGFLSALAAGGEARERISDPTVESTLALRRLVMLAPELRSVLAVDDEGVLLWTNDRIASRSVHLSEVAWLRYDPATAELLLESVDPAAIAADRSIERDYTLGQYDAVLEALDDLREDDRLVREILAEGLESVEFSRPVGSTDFVEIDFIGTVSQARVRLAPVSPEEPLR